MLTLRAMSEAPAGRPPLPEPPLGSPVQFALLALGGAALAHLAVWLGCSLRDGGLMDGAAQVLGKKLLSQAWWRLPGVLLMGAFLHRFYAALLSPGQRAWPMLWGIARAFIHFALFGMVALFGFMLGAAVMGYRHLARKRPKPRPEDGPTLIERWVGVPIWFIILPLTLAGAKNEGDMTLPVTVARRALLRLLPALLACVYFWTRATSEDTGEHVDPFWLSAFASFWLAEFLVVALRVTPVLRARRGLAP